MQFRLKFCVILLIDTYPAAAARRSGRAGHVDSTGCLGESRARHEKTGANRGCVCCKLAAHFTPALQLAIERTESLERKGVLLCFCFCHGCSCGCCLFVCCKYFSCFSDCWGAPPVSACAGATSLHILDLENRTKKSKCKSTQTRGFLAGARGQRC